MGTGESRPAHPHPNTEVCEPALPVYREALRTGRVPRAELGAVPCLVDPALLHPDPWDDTWIRPEPPSVALAHLLQPVSRTLGATSRTHRGALLARSGIAEADRRER